MLHIFICEDDLSHQKMILDCIQKHITFEEYDIDITLCTRDPNKIIDIIKETKINGLYFLDVELDGGYNGVSVAKEIRQHDPRGYIVFVTAHPRYMSLTFEYKVEALDYINKTNANEVQQKICTCITNAYRKHVSRSEEERYIFKTQNGHKISCDHADILFFQTDNRGTKRIILHAKKRQYTFYGTLDEVMESLPKGVFYSCHKSYIININNISAFNIQKLQEGSLYIIMENGVECRISTRKRSDLLKMIEVMHPEYVKATEFRKELPRR